MRGASSPERTPVPAVPIDDHGGRACGRPLDAGEQRRRRPAGEQFPQHVRDGGHRLEEQFSLTAAGKADLSDLFAVNGDRHGLEPRRASSGEHRGRRGLHPLGTRPAQYLAILPTGGVDSDQHVPGESRKALHVDHPADHGLLSGLDLSAHCFGDVLHNAPPPVKEARPYPGGYAFSMASVTAVIVVDVQRDFCEGGNLPVAGGATVAGRISEHLASDAGRAYRFVVATRDWHVDPGDHFAPAGTDPDYGDSWPQHCVAGTSGAEWHPDLRLPDEAVVVSKGHYERRLQRFRRPRR